MQTYLKNIIDVYRRADLDSVRQGHRWYMSAHLFATSYDYSAEVGAGVVAALSPNTSWDRNKELADIALTDGVITGGTLGASIVKANRILAGEAPLDVLGGLKVRSFYQNILNPNDYAPVTIDRHAYDIALNKRHGNNARKINTPGQYEAMANYYRVAASMLGPSMKPNQLQAITWEQWRKEAA